MIESIALRRIIGGDERLYFLARANIFINPLAKKLLAIIETYYQKYTKFPTEEELRYKCSNSELNQFLEQLLINPINEALSAEFIFYEMKNQRGRTLFLDQTIKLVDSLSDFDSEEISNSLYDMSIGIKELSDVEETVFNPAEAPVRATRERARRLPSGMDKFDKINGGFSLGDLIMVGGRRGSGKSLFALNILLNYFQNYDFSTAFFSIEMPHSEVNDRLDAMISNVHSLKFAKGELNDEDVRQILRARLNNFFDLTSERVLETLDQLNNPSISVDEIEGSIKFLPKQDKQYFIIDDPTLTIPKLDYYLSVLRRKSKAPLLAAVVDYLNIINTKNTNNQSSTDWQVQNDLAKELKLIARKNGIILISPYQIDATGKARLAVAIEDHIDTSLKFLPTQEQKQQGIFPIFIDKQRNGRDDFDFQMILDKQSLRLKNLDEQYSAEGDEDEDSEGFTRG